MLAGVLGIVLVTGHGRGDLRSGQKPPRGKQADHQIYQAFGTAARHDRHASSDAANAVTDAAHQHHLGRPKLDVMTRSGQQSPDREPPGQPPDGHPSGHASESVGTVLVAGAANLAIAAAKAMAGLLSGSSSMLSEAAHSVADTTTEVMLYIALRRGSHPADRRHPFGYGRAAFIWALFAAFFTFGAGAGFSIFYGLDTIRNGEDLGNPMTSYIVLAISFAIESASLARGLRQTRGAAARRRIRPLRYLRLTPDTTVKAVVLEDTAALIGLVLAGFGLAVTTATGDAFWDGLASVLIGVLLLVVAGVLASANTALLIGKAVSPRLERLIIDSIRAVPLVEEVLVLYTQQLGIDSVLVAAKVDFTDTATAAQLEDACALAESRLQAQFPMIRHVFLHPTGRRALTTPR
jgi:cation diffusion facilitator family transporter